MRSTFFVSLLFLSCSCWAQGPKASYFYNPATELAWAECYLYQHGGSRQRIPFLAVIGADRAPLGTRTYTKDIDLQGRLVFIGNGIAKENAWDSYSGRRSDYTIGTLDVTGKVVMLCYDSPDSIAKLFESEYPVEKRIATAVARGASAVILFSYGQQYPFVFVEHTVEPGRPDIPVITITQLSAIRILESAGDNGEATLHMWGQSAKPPASEELISNLELRIKGKFENLDTDHFSFNFRKEEFSQKDIAAIAEVNEASLRFLLEHLKDQHVTWKKPFIVYFRDYDSKVFYTHHWGKGLSGEAGIFYVHQEGPPSPGLTVHELTHTLTSSNWTGNATSFLNEGFAMYTEALATEHNKNHLKTVQFLEEQKLFPLADMMTFEIGMPGLETDVAYPASGSFVDYLIRSYGLNTFREVFVLEARSDEERARDNSWTRVYQKTVPGLEQDWLAWLRKSFKK